MRLNVVTECAGVPAEMMQPKLAWCNETAYEQRRSKLAARFCANFEKYAKAVDADVIAAGPAGCLNDSRASIIDVCQSVASVRAATSLKRSVFSPACVLWRILAARNPRST
jgi:hypothetical protein